MSEYIEKAMKLDKDKPISVNHKKFNLMRYSDITVKPDREY